jgi:hypothetical protein
MTQGLRLQRAAEVRCKNGVVQADVNGDKIADLETKINLPTLSKGDFFL